MSYVIFLGTTFAGALIIFTWLFLCWLIVGTLLNHWGWVAVLLISWATSIAIFFQGTRLREWLDAI